jgi:glyoxylase-like metal-dependent hydrolase (beta-lactamase superfamily II)
MLSYTELSTNVFIVREPTDRRNRLNSLLIEANAESGSILIDTNYPFGFIDELYTRIKAPVKALYCSHCHLDHTAHAFYHQEKYSAPVYCPIQEADYLTSIDILMENAGFKRLRLNDSYIMMVREYMKFKECEKVNSFEPGVDSITYPTGNIDTIHIPGHSPGQTAFLIKPNDEQHDRKILYVSDIGSHPYYGDLNCDLKAYHESLNKLEKLYLSDDFILVPAHSTVYMEKDDEFFDRIRKRIEANETKVLSALSQTNPKSIKELVYEGVLTPPDRMNSLVKDLYLLWDGGMVLQHLIDFQERGIVKKVEEKDLVNDKYLIIS